MQIFGKPHRGVPEGVWVAWGEGGRQAESQQHRHVERADPGVEVPVPYPLRQFVRS